MSNLTKRQKEILDFIKKFYNKNDYSPTMNEVASHFKVSIPTIQGHFKELIYKGYIKKQANKSRAIAFKDEIPQNRTASLPLLGTISAGEGINVYQEPEPDFIEVPSSWVSVADINDYYSLKVSGFSMCEDGILDDDIIVIKRQSIPDFNGDKVVAILKNSEEMVTLKKFYDHGDKIELRPSNSSVKSKFFDKDEIEIRGKFVGLIRGV